METSCVQTQYCHPLPPQCQRTASERSVPSPRTLGTTDRPILPDSAYPQECREAAMAPNLPLVLVPLVPPMSPCLQDFRTGQTALFPPARVPCPLKTRARLPIAQFPFSSCGSGSLREGTVPALCLDEAVLRPRLFDSAVLVQVGSELQRWGGVGWGPVWLVV